MSSSEDLAFLAAHPVAVVKSWVCQGQTSGLQENKASPGLWEHNVVPNLAWAWEQPEEASWKK